MPKVSKPRRHRRRAHKRPKRGNSLAVARGRGLRLGLGTGLPAYVRCNMVYTDLANQIVETGGVGYTSYRVNLNDVYDCDNTGGGFQPPLYDDLTKLYKRWRVMSVKVTATIENYTNYPTYLTLVGQFDPTTNNPTVPASASTYDLMALPEYMRSNRVRVSTVQTGDKNTTVVSKRFYPGKIVGENYHSSVNYAGEAGASPAKLVVCDLIFQSGAPTTPEIGCWLTWKMEFDVMFFNQDAVENAKYD